MNDEDYEYVKGTYRYKKGSTPDRSRETDGAWRGTTRDADGHLDGQGEFIPGDGYDTMTIQPGGGAVRGLAGSLSIRGRLTSPAPPCPISPSWFPLRWSQLRVLPPVSLG